MADTAGPAVDMWSMGCTFAELLEREPFLQGVNGNTIDQLGKIFRALGTPTEVSVHPQALGLRRKKNNSYKSITHYRML